MIQILGLRPYVDKKTGKTKKSEKFFNRGWRASSVKELFKTVEEILTKIPEEEHFNLYYTACECKEEKGRKFIRQNIVPFDIDNIDRERVNDYIDPILDVLGQLEYTDVGIVATGNGLQFIVELDYYFDDAGYFERNREAYKGVNILINNKLEQLGLPGNSDDSVWGPGQLLRLPETKNLKTPETGFPNKNSENEAKILQRNIAPITAFDLQNLASLGMVEEKDFVSDKEMKVHAKPDTETVLQECAFLVHCKENQNSITEENWYKMLSVVSRLENGHELCHEYSSEHPDYDVHETNVKIAQSQRASGPRTCANICTTFDGCYSCPHYQEVKSPILIRSADHIATEGLGFRKRHYDQNGNMKHGPVEYGDLYRAFYRDHKYITADEEIYAWTGTHWELMEKQFVREYCERKVKPDPTDRDAREFIAKLLRNHVVKREFFNKSTFRKMNLANGVLDLAGSEPELLEHSPKFGFMSVLPYEYDPAAECPRFDAFLKEVTQKDEEMEAVLMEFAGYAFSNMEYIHHKAAILTGAGSNGKSTYLNVLKNLASEGSYSSITADKFSNPQYTAKLEGKLFNIAEETPDNSFLDGSAFKNITAGGNVEVKIVYKMPYEIRNRAKIMMACNTLPGMRDFTQGMKRRLMIIPFERQFTEADMDIHLEEKLKKEAPGILNRIIEGYYRLVKQGAFTESKAISQAVREYVLESTPITEFMEEYLIIHAISGRQDLFVSSQDLYDMYMQYCENTKLPYADRVNKSKLIKDIKELAGSGSARHGRRNGVRGLFDIALRTTPLSVQNKTKEFYNKGEADGV